MELLSRLNDKRGCPIFLILLLKEAILLFSDEGVAEKLGRSEATEDFVARGSRVCFPL
jgi:hypothetical protein